MRCWDIRQEDSHRTRECGVIVRGVKAGTEAQKASAPKLQGKEGNCSPPQLPSGSGKTRTCMGDGKAAELKAQCSKK